MGKSFNLVSFTQNFVYLLFLRFASKPFEAFSMMFLAFKKLMLAIKLCNKQLFNSRGVFPCQTSQTERVAKKINASEFVEMHNDFFICFAALLPFFRFKLSKNHVKTTLILKHRIKCLTNTDTMLFPSNIKSCL